MSRTLYTVLTRLALPLLFARLWWRGRKQAAYRLRWRERLALYDVAPRPCPVLFHAVSVGEVHAAQPLIRSLLAARPGLRIAVTTTTPTGSARVRELFGDQVEHVYLPYDLPGAVQRLLRHFSPAVLVLLETELWPNLLHACKQQGRKVLLANARLSARSHARYHKHPRLGREMLQCLDLVAAQAQADGERFLALGLSPDRLRINGSLKFDVSVDAARLAQAHALKARWQGRPVWIAASTREGEDEQVLQAAGTVWQALPDTLLLLVPRHPERFATAAALARSAGLPVQRYSETPEPAATTRVLVGDTMGDLPFYYALADVAFVGGSLVDTGCQNLIEPAALGLPVLSGPSLYNFQAVSELLREQGGMLVVADAAELGREVLRLLREPDAAATMGARAKAVVAGNQGATERLLALILERC